MGKKEYDGECVIVYPAPPFLSVLRPTGRKKKLNPCEEEAFVNCREYKQLSAGLDLSSLNIHRNFQLRTQSMNEEKNKEAKQTLDPVNESIVQFLFGVFHLSLSAGKKNMMELFLNFMAEGPMINLLYT